MVDDDKLRIERLLEAIDKAAGSLVDVDIPGWESREAAVEWGRASRRMSATGGLPSPGDSNSA